MTFIKKYIHFCDFHVKLLSKNKNLSLGIDNATDFLFPRALSFSNGNDKKSGKNPVCGRLTCLTFAKSMLHFA